MEEEVRAERGRWIENMVSGDWRPSHSDVVRVAEWSDHMGKSLFLIKHLEFLLRNFGENLTTASDDAEMQEVMRLEGRNQ